ncbi:putative porin [Shewanella sp. 202IG2-18]|uniref:putative porin n=1 Tax=Parashewanella hymeniacidonis TaxID=2807618 RepID=UPI00195F261D|nr:putative porin [Parashewanella hymeniacidonis]MBM7071708.1 putative porin [Parashewanella hymeniacidonis]
MKFNRTQLALLIGCISLSSYAAQDEKYHHEGGIGTYDNTSVPNSDAYWIGDYTYYSKGIDQNKGPYRLNAFLAHSSQVHLKYKHRDDFDAYTIKGKLFFGDHWFVAGLYDYTDDLGTGENTYKLELGNYISDTAKVYISAQRLERDISPAKYDYDKYAIGAKGFIQTSGDMGFLLKAEYLFKEYKISDYKSDSHGYLAEADYFFTKSFSVGGFYSDGNHEDKSYGGRANYFLRLTDNLSLDLSVDKKYEPKEDGTNWGARLVGRF